VNARRVAPLLLLVAASGSLACGSLGHWLTTPTGSFDSLATPPPPDYADAKNWAALPGKKSRANDLPPVPGVALAGPNAPVDLFFVPPTTYYWRSHWNAPARGPLTDLITGAVLANQASAFNGVARIYAPRYRQMTLTGFQDPTVRGRGLEVAYQDVRRAFLHYRAESSEGRPLILAGHSQGSRLLLRLVHEFFLEEPLRGLLVAAYIPGARVGSGPYERSEARVPICASARDTGCLVSWRSFAEGADASLDRNPGEPEDGPAICVNPLSWRHDAERAPSWTNLGSVPLAAASGTGRPQPGLTGARCDPGAGALRIQSISRRGFRLGHEQGDWHAYDYALFYMNVRQNARQRVDAYLARSPVE